MPLSQDDRKIFSLKIVSADQEISNYEKSKTGILTEKDKLQKLDNANKHLFDPVNTLVNQYQLEFTALDGNQRTTFTESDIQYAAGVKLRNFFYPNDPTVSVPSLNSVYNVWTKAKPYARGYAVGKNYSEVYPILVQKEGDIISAILTYITSSIAYSDIQLTTGLHLVPTGSCSLILYTNQTDCLSHGGVWSPGADVLDTYTDVVSLKNNIVSNINSLISFLNTELSYVVTNDKDTGNQTQNNAAINNINNVILPALNTWLAYVDFNSAGVDASNFNLVDPNGLAPTKLHSAQLTALQTALNTRLSYITTRTTQLTNILGTITQDLTTGESVVTGLYGKRYSFLLLRLDTLNGSLSKLASIDQGLSAQTSIINSIKSAKQTYQSVLPTTAFLSSGNDTSIVQLVDPSFLSVGDTVYIMAESQVELLRAVKAINGKVVTLNDIVPIKYKTTDKLRLYKDISQ